MKISHLVKLHFDKRSEAATPEWFARRFKFFRDWTRLSLYTQTFQDFVIWIHCDPGMEETMVDLQDILSTMPMPCVFTFQPYGETPLTDMPESERDRLLAADYVYVTRIDSDDLYVHDALALVNAARPQQPGRVEAAIFRRGYMHDLNTGELAVYHNPSSPFHTLMFPREIFCDPDAYRRNFVGDHSQVGSAYPVQVLPDWRFTVLIHGGNFITTMDYSREPKTPVERGWTVERFLRQPVVFDLDDFADAWNILPELDHLKDVYPDFRCTLFAIPEKCSPALLREAKSRDWIELGVHGITHTPNEELKAVDAATLGRALRGLDYDTYARVFRPPGWYITSEHVAACNAAGVAVALHVRDRKTLGSKCRHGYYCCDEARPYAHFHTHRTCGNGIQECLPELLTRWIPEQAFSFVSDAVLIPQGEYQPCAST